MFLYPVLLTISFFRRMNEKIAWVRFRQLAVFCCERTQKCKEKKTILVTVLVTVLTVATVVIASHISVSGISIPQVDEPDFQAMFPDAPIGALGALLPAGGGFVASNPDGTLVQIGFGGTVTRLQSAVYEGVGAADGLYAYLYQVDCTGGLTAPIEVSIPLSGATLNPTAAGLSTTPFGYISTYFDVPVPYEALPYTIFTANLTLFNLSEFGPSGVGIGGNTAAGWTDASLDLDEVLAGSTTDNYWSGTILLFVTDRAPVISHVTVLTHPTVGGQPNTVAALVPTTPGVGPAPDLPPDDIIEEPPPVVEAIPVDVDVKPGSYPNAINPKSKGVLPVAILGSPTFDVLDIDTDTVAVACMGVEGAALRTAVEDVDGDENDDLVFHVSMQAFPWGAAPGTEVTLTVEGKLLDGTPFFGDDVIWIVPPK